MENASPNQTVDFVICGETLIDMIPQSDGSQMPVAGGSPKNTATALARIGNNVGLISRVGNDALGDRIRKQLVESGVSMQFLRNTQEPTTLAMATIDDAGAASYSFYIEGCADGTWSPDDLPQGYQNARYCVVAGSFSLVIPGMSETFEHFFTKDENRIVVFDPNIRPILANKRKEVLDRMERWVSSSTIVKASSEDIEWAYPGVSAATVAKEWLAKGPALVAITDGGNGAAMYTASNTISMDAPTIDVIDTVGAGDTFTAGLVDWLYRNEVTHRDHLLNLPEQDLAEALSFAIALAAETCKQQGANPPWDRPNV